jgi:hypothetical protein
MYIMIYEGLYYMAVVYTIYCMVYTIMIYCSIYQDAMVYVVGIYHGKCNVYSTNIPWYIPHHLLFIHFPIYTMVYIVSIYHGIS